MKQTTLGVTQRLRRAAAAVERASRALTEPVPGLIERNRLLSLAWRTGIDFVDDDCPGMAAAIAYYALFSLFPLLLGLIAALGLVLNAPGLEEELTGWVASYLAGSEDLLVGNIRHVVRAREEAGVLAVVGLFWSGMAVFGAIRKALNAAWDLDRSRSLLGQKLLDLAMVGGVGFFFLLSVSLTALYGLLQQWEVPWLGWRPFYQGWLEVVVGMALPAALTFLAFVLVYKMIPYTRVSWAAAVCGGSLAALLFELAKSGFLWYLQSFGRYELVYGSLGAVIGLLMWIYLSALILLLGAELAAEYGKMEGRRGLGD